jgi:UDP-N-acetylmuramate dehydrogenase
VTALDRADAVFAARSMTDRVQRDHPLGAMTTYRVGGAAARFVLAEHEDDLVAVAEAAAAGGLPTVVVGRGSNLLVADRGFAGIAVQLGAAFATFDLDGCVATIGGATSLPVAARRSASAGCTGFEWAVGVPGSLGGAVRMNAGGHGSDIAASIVDARVVDLRAAGAVEVWTPARLALGYRRSALGAAHVVTAARLRLHAGDPAQSLAAIDEIVRWRRDNQPGGQNAGSVFTNPPGDSAGRLIDTAGAKGLRVGSAHVSTKHANFVQADEGGSADDVRAVMDEVVRRVRAVHGIELVPETCMVGFDDTAHGARDIAANGEG